MDLGCRTGRTTWELAKDFDKVTFLQSDPSNMKSVFVGYDLILVNDILDQMYNPRHFLSTIHERINPNGRLVIATGFDWSEEYTVRENQVGGYRCSGEQIWGEEEILIFTNHFLPYYHIYHIFNALIV